MTVLNAERAMTRHYIGVCVVTASMIALSGCCQPNATIGSASVNLRAQETNNWCWAATTQMVTEFLGHGRTQCDLANERFGRTDCCNGGCPKNAACNMPGWTMFNESNFNSTASATPLGWADITKEVFCRKRPMAYAYGPKTGGVGHVVVLSGYVEVGGIRYLSLNDPWSPCAGNNRLLTYDEYSNSPTVDHWETTWAIVWRS